MSAVPTIAIFAVEGVSQQRPSCAPAVALSLGSLRRRIEALLLPDNVVLQLDGPAERDATAAGRSLAR